MLRQLKFRYCEKTTKFEKKFHLFWNYLVTSKFKILWCSQNTWTLQLLIYEAFMIWFTLFRIFMHWSNENIGYFRVDRKRTILLPFDWLKKCGILNSKLVKQCHEHFIIVMCLVNYPNQVQIPNGFLKEFFMLSDICGFPWSILELILLHQYFWM